MKSFSDSLIICPDASEHMSIILIIVNQLIKKVNAACTNTCIHMRELPDTKMQDLLALKGEDLWTVLLVIFCPNFLNLVPGMSLSMKVPKHVEYLFQGLTALLKGHSSSVPNSAINIMMRTLIGSVAVC